MIRLEGATLPPESQGAVPPMLFGELLRDVPGIPIQLGPDGGRGATLAKNCGIDAADTVLDLAGPDISKLMETIPASGVVQIGDEWIQYRGLRAAPPGLIVGARGHGGTSAVLHEQGAAVAWVETRPLYVLAYVPPGCSYPPDAVVSLRVNDSTQFPAATVRLADERLVPGVRLVTVEFDASRWISSSSVGRSGLSGYGFAAYAPLPSSLTLVGVGGGGNVLRAARTSSGLGRAVGPAARPDSSSGPRFGSGPRLAPPAAVPVHSGISNVAAPTSPPTRSIVRLSQSPLGRVTADLRGLVDTAAGRYTGTPNAPIVTPAHVVRLLLEETFRETNSADYHAPTWAATAARQAARGLKWRVAWTGGAFEGFREAAELCGQADLYLDEDGLWRYAFRDPSAPAMGTVTPRELIGDPGVGWTSGREITTELEVAWGDGGDAGSFTLDSPAMANRHGRNHGALSLPYAATESVARLLARYELSRRDRPRQGATIQASHAFLGLTLRDRVFIDTPLLRLYGAGRIPYDVVGVTDRGDARVLTLLESDPLAVELLLSGNLETLTVFEVLLSGALAAGELVVAVSGTLIRPATPLSRALAGTLLRPATPLAVALAGTLAEPTGGALSVALAGTLIRPATPVAPTLTGTLDAVAPPGLAWDAAGATWDAAGATWDPGAGVTPVVSFPNALRSTGTTGVAAKSVTLPVTVAAGSLVVVAGNAWRATDPGPFGVTDSLGTPYTVLPATSGAAGAGTQRGFLAYGIAPTAGVVTVTVAASGAGTLLSFGVVEIPNAAAIDATGTESTGVGGAPSGTVTTTVPDAIVLGLLAVMQNSGTAGMLPSAGSTQIFEDEDATNAPSSLVWKRAPTAGAHSANWTITTGGSPPWRVLTLAVKG